MLKPAKGTIFAPSAVCLWVMEVFFITKNLWCKSKIIQSGNLRTCSIFGKNSFEENPFHTAPHFFFAQRICTGRAFDSQY